MTDYREVYVDLPIVNLRPGDVFEGGGGAHREHIRVEEIGTDDDRIWYTGICRGSKGKPVRWSGAPDEKVFVVERGPGPTFEEINLGIKFDPQGQVVLSESSPRPGVLVDNDLYDAFLDRVSERFL